MTKAEEKSYGDEDVEFMRRGLFEGLTVCHSSTCISHVHLSCKSNATKTPGVGHGFRPCPGGFFKENLLVNLRREVGYCL